MGQQIYVLHIVIYKFYIFCSLRSAIRAENSFSLNFLYLHDAKKKVQPKNRTQPKNKTQPKNRTQLTGKTHPTGLAHPW